MTDSELLLKIATVDGWTCSENSWFSPTGDAWSQRRSGGRWIKVEDILPPYTSSMDSIIAVVKKRWKSHKTETGTQWQIKFYSKLPESECLLFATPKQICEALLFAEKSNQEQLEPSQTCRHSYRDDSTVCEICGS